MLDVQLVQEQRFRLSITPEIKQSFHLLTLSGQELIRYLQDAVADNPLLELEEISFSPYRSARVTEQLWHGAYDPLLQARGAEPTLEQVLASQIRITLAPEEQKKAAVYLAGSLNDNGYLKMELDEVRAELGMSMDQVTAGLKLLQSLEPVGVGARNLQECLLLQIQRDASAVQHAEQMVLMGLEALVPFHPGRMAGKLGITAQAAQQAYDYITRLDPKPCRSIGCDESLHYVTPDAAVELVNGEMMLSLYTAGNFRVSLNEACKSWIRETSPGERWGRRAAEARSILRSVQLRRRTLLRVITAVMDEQKRFLSEGPDALVPLNLAVIAERINMHESTVSRAVNGKTIRTPFGMYSLKAFFDTGLKTLSGHETSSLAVKRRLREIIRSESLSRPYSDSQLAAILAGEGIVISRRTVAKYRDELRILPSLERKRWV
ncbi:RNA polymerase factor sigma-54 [Paenibacillus barcinonensis]|uniref:RNA polymerase RpoN-/SigL-like sigma 54 subunit n=1 Tax=Paenibacillus barcinonensis TaxID=198119 RepID=A0A2V4WLS7_PAEBA|nr:RNA polymerase factor sigma-54 [Paenibacillus barcinonensis]PYE48577.1 RNA polymerase RpoN-/SigL-like sigma 54 subunit [Paenibacillus barcinonensis]QKS58728.1 RNA polymerase factor sigma-54 [Paenibacillus barcinonensis]